MKRYYVIGPEWGQVVPVLDDGSGPTEYGRDVVPVEAPDEQTAKVIGIRLMREDSRSYLSRYGDENPFTGLYVQEIQSDADEDFWPYE